LNVCFFYLVTFSTAETRNASAEMLVRRTRRDLKMFVPGFTKNVSRFNFAIEFAGGSAVEKTDLAGGVIKKRPIYIHDFFGWIFRGCRGCGSPRSCCYVRHV
jgi:hypothetical protein